MASIRAFAFASATVVVLAGAASASLLNPGVSFHTTLGFAPGEAAPTGSAIASLNSPFTSGAYTGNLNVVVLQGDATNPLGGLTFVYTLSNNAGSEDAINRLTLAGFAGWQVDASYDIASMGVVPFDIDRSNGSGNVIGVDFQQNASTVPLTPGTTGRRIVVQTNAPAFREIIANVIDGSVTSVTTLGPNIPTPGAAALLGLGALAAGRRRRTS
jgi:MYXO-CTERM domain-containing protein